jgi:hypothetical protein
VMRALTPGSVVGGGASSAPWAAAHHTELIRVEQVVCGVGALVGGGRCCRVGGGDLRCVCRRREESVRRELMGSRARGARVQQEASAGTTARSLRLIHR